MATYIARYLVTDQFGTIVKAGVVDIHTPGFDLTSTAGAADAYRAAGQVADQTVGAPNCTTVVTSLVEAG